MINEGFLWYKSTTATLGPWISSYAKYKNYNLNTSEVFIFLRHMQDSHGLASFQKSSHLWFACQPCGILTTDRDSHNKRFHLLQGENTSDPVPITVRLLLPTTDTITANFLSSDTVSSVLAAHSAFIREKIGDLGPEEELTICCEDKVFVPGQFCAKLSNLERWDWGGEKEIHLEYRIRPSSLQISSQDADREGHERAIERLTRKEGMMENDLFEVASMMNQDRNMNPVQTNPMTEELLIATKHPGNPFHHNQFPFNVNQNTYSTMLRFTKEQMPIVYSWVLHLRDPSHQSVDKDVIPVVQLVAQMMAMVSRTNSALAATKTMVLKSGGLTNVALDATQRSSYCQTSSNFRKKRQSLANLAEDLVKKATSSLKPIMPMFVIDNLNLKFQWFSHDFTQCLLMYKDVDTSGNTKLCPRFITITTGNNLSVCQ